ncbi:MAG: glycosyltransferase, partial [Limnoraphis robusta]
MLDFTIAIPTYNGAKRLPQVLDKLRSQTDVEQISWEVIVVDNNSTDNTAEIVQQYQQNWLLNVPLRYC